jgi:polyribonucleotide 5'-hydroxyl-kinase
MATPLMYYFGHTNPAENIPLYKHYITSLAQKVDLRQEHDPNSASSGIIVSTSGWIDGPGYDTLQDIIRLYSIDLIIVIGHDRLYSLLSAYAVSSAPANSDPSNPPLTVIKLPKSGGTVYRSDSDRRRLRRSKITEYFYGKRSPSDLMTSLSSLSSATSASTSLQSQIESLPNRYSPSRIELSLKNYNLLKPGGIQLPQSMMPLGQSMEKTATNINELKLVSCPLSIDLEHAVIAVLHGTNTLHGASGTAPTLVTPSTLVESAGDGDPLQLLLSTNVAGFICVVKIDLEHDILTVLSPCPGHLPSTNILVGAIKWVE